jgi:hypothetical protein
MAMKYRYVSKNGKYKIRWRPGPIDAIMMAHRAQRICGNVAAEGFVSRVTPVHTAMRNSTRDEGRPFEVDNQVLISSHRKLLWSKAMVVSVAEKPKQDSGRHD